MPRFVAVLNHDSTQGRLAENLSESAANCKVALDLRTHGELADEVDLVQSIDEPARVDPDRPMLWLGLGGTALLDTPDDRFVSAEAHAAARSIALLTRSPVLNRPTAVGSNGRLPWTQAVSVRRCRSVATGGVQVRKERFTSAPPQNADGDLEVFDYGLGRASFRVLDEPAGPYRYRDVVRGATHSTVRIVGTRVVTQSGTASPTVVDASRHIAARYELDFASFWWLVEPRGGAATLSRIDCHAWDRALGMDVAVVASALLACLRERVAAVGKRVAAQ